jgi:hypothetical protein
VSEAESRGARRAPSTAPARSWARDPVPPPPPHDSLPAAHEQGRPGGRPADHAAPYGHLAAHYLKKDLERLTFGPPAPLPASPAPTPIAGQAATSPPQLPQEPQNPDAAGGARSRRRSPPMRALGRWASAPPPSTSCAHAACLNTSGSSTRFASRQPLCPRLSLPRAAPASPRGQRHEEVWRAHDLHRAVSATKNDFQSEQVQAGVVP